jgi:tetratricopeptide (TPR) repeat protein
MIRFILLWLAMGTALSQEMTEQQLRDMLGPQANLLISESLPAGQAYAKLINEGKSVDMLNALGEYFTTVGKPMHARSTYEKTLALNAQNETAKSGLATSKERIEYLAGRLQHFESEYQKTNNYQNRCSQAAILFHIGKPREAITLLKELQEAGEVNQEIQGLQYSFQQSFFLKKMALEVLAADHRQALGDKNLEAALVSLGQMIFLSMGEMPTQPYFERLETVFPEEFDKNRIAKLTAYVIDWNVDWPSAKEG